MEYLIAVFKSRTQVMKFHERLQSNNIASSIINTPREAAMGCGLSVKFYTEDYHGVLNILRTENYYSFAGFFRVNESGRHLTVRPY